MAGSFAATISEWGRAELERAEAIFQASAQALANEVREPGPSVASTSAAIEKGLGTGGRGKNKLQIQGPVGRTGAGRMPVDTGNLRRSLMASTAEMPSIKEGKEEFTDSGIEMVIEGAALGSTIYLGFQAAYALRMEYGFVGTDSLGRTYNQSGFGFVTAAAQRWPQIVAEQEAKIRSRFEAGPAAPTS